MDSYDKLIYNIGSWNASKVYQSVVDSREQSSGIWPPRGWFFALSPLHFESIFQSILATANWVRQTISISLLGNNR